MTDILRIFGAKTAIVPAFAPYDKRIPKARLKSRALALGIALTLTGCSSIPNFSPSKPVEEASSLDEALGLCAAYQIKGEQNSSGRALPARSPVLVPWITCFEQIFRKFPTAQNRESLVMFFRALQSKHSGGPATLGYIDWPAMNQLVPMVVQHLRSPELAYSVEERLLLERQLPDYWIYLAESGRLRKGTKSGEVRQSRLQELRREVEGPGASTATDSTAKAPLRPLPLSPEQKEYCKKYLGYRTTLHNLEDLSEYKRVLDASTSQDVSNANERTMRERVDKRFAAMKQDAAEQKRELDAELGTMQAGASWFRNAHCLEGTTMLKRSTK